MEFWQLDVMGGVLLTDGRELKAVTGIDDHSRFCIAVGLVERATSRPVCGVFAHALARYGAPEEVLTDNGKVFTGRYAGKPMEVLFDRICRENGIIHRLTAVRSPTTTGKIERFHGRRTGENGVPQTGQRRHRLDIVVSLSSRHGPSMLTPGHPAGRGSGP